MGDAGIPTYGTDILFDEYDEWCFLRNCCVLLLMKECDSKITKPAHLHIDGLQGKMADVLKAELLSLKCSLELKRTKQF